MHAVHYRAIYMERLCFMRYSSNIAQTIYVSFTDRLHIGEEVNCVGEMFGHHVRSKCEIGRTYSKFGRTLSHADCYAPVNWNPHPGEVWGIDGVTEGFGTFLSPSGWGICCFLLHQFCPWGGGLVRFWHSWTSKDWGEWVVSMCFLISKGGFKMDDIKVLCWFIFFPIKLRAQELFIIVLKSIKMK